MEPALRLWILVVIIALYVLYIYVGKRGRLFEGFQSVYIYTPSQIDRAVAAVGYDTSDNIVAKDIFMEILMNNGNLQLRPVDIFKSEEDYNYINGIYTKWVGYMTDPENRYFIPPDRLKIPFTEVISNNMKSLRATAASIQSPYPITLGKSTTATNSRVTACRELNDLHKKYVDLLALARKQMDDLSGTEVLGGNLKDENMKFQYLYEDKCTGHMTLKGTVRQYDIDESNSCKRLASQDDILHNTIIPGYDMTNITLFKQAVRIEEQFDTINTVISLTACDISGEFAIDPEVDIGTINVEEIKEKLNELSPYFISSGTLDFVTKYLVGNGILDTALYTSTEILSFVKNNLETGIRPLANDQFGIK